MGEEVPEPVSGSDVDERQEPFPEFVLQLVWHRGAGEVDVIDRNHLLDGLDELGGRLAPSLEGVGHP